MKIKHRITFSRKDAVDTALDALGIKYKKWPLPGGSYTITLDIDESDYRWEQISELVRVKGAADIVWTTFAKKELLGAQWLRLVPTFEQGYPQPEETWLGNPVNYEVRCPECGIFRQSASFRLKKEPRLGKNDFVSLFWTYALFCSSQVLHEIEANDIRGYEVWDAIIDKTGASSETISQLYIPTVTDPGLIRTEDLPTETCSSCGVTKYYPHKRGVMYLKRGDNVPDVDIMQTYEWFGSRLAAYREIVISNKFARLIIDKGWKGVALKVVELT